MNSIPSNNPFGLDDILNKLNYLLPSFSAFENYQIKERTDVTLEVHIPIEQNLYVHLYANFEKTKT